jgi:ABC-type glycerol-3-phosphate transport system substrate-binding protein
VRIAAALLVVITLAAAGCGGSDESGEEESERATVECEGTAVTPDLPADFPQVDGVTFTESTIAGPTKVADGYYEGSLEDAYEKFKSAFEDAGYDVTFDEIEEDDSEVAYKGGDENRTGIVALRENCKQDGRVSVHVTSRPA